MGGDLPGTDDPDGAALQVNPNVTTISAAMQDPVWIKTITDAIMATNKDGGVCTKRAAMIQKFTILPADFSVQTGELTPTLKLKRSVVQKKHDEVIARLYASKDAYVPFVG